MTKTNSILQYLKALNADHTQAQMTNGRTWCF